MARSTIHVYTSTETAELVLVLAWIHYVFIEGAVRKSATSARVGPKCHPALWTKKIQRASAWPPNDQLETDKSFCRRTHQNDSAYSSRTAVKGSEVKISMGKFLYQ